MKKLKCSKALECSYWLKEPIGKDGQKQLSERFDCAIYWLKKIITVVKGLRRLLLTVLLSNKVCYIGGIS